MNINAETKRVRSPLRSVRMWKIAVVLLIVSVGIQIEGQTSKARTGQANIEFCSITDANRLFKRARMQGEAVGIQLLTNRREVEAGEMITASLANFTKKYFLSVAEFKIQRYEPAGWQTDPSSPDGPWPRSAAKLRPGKAIECYRYLVPEDQPAGRYRFLTMVHNRTKQFPEVAKFSVLKTAG